MNVKKLLVVFLLLAGLTAVAFASFNSNRKKADTEKKVEKKECQRKCMFS
jgi:uncharacterized protein involved in outer membrane biogenesis